MTRQDRMIEKLKEAFAPAHLDVADESRLHAGHAGHRPGGETHYRVHIVSAAFKGKSRIDRHRMVNGALADELACGIHALAIEARAPGEDSGDKKQ
jgi:BolA protein